MNTTSHAMKPPPAPKGSRTCSETATTATTLPSGRVGRGGCDILDTANAHTGTGESAEGRLGTGAGGLGAVTTSGPDLNMEGSDAKLLAAGSCSRSVSMTPPAFLGVRTDVLGCQHGSVGRGLVTIGLDLHATGDTGDGFAARQIGDVDEGVVEGSEDTGNAEHKLALLKRSIRVPTLSLADSTCLADLRSKLLQPLAHVHCRGVQKREPGCSPAHRARPSSWEAC
jgi:hypothetical protein